MRQSNGGGGNFLTGFIIALILLMAALIVYIVNWYAERARIAADNARYLAMYSAALETPEASPSPEPTATVEISPVPTESEAPVEATPTPQPTATAEITPVPTETEAPAEATPTPQPTATAEATPVPTETEAPIEATPTPQPTATVEISPVPTETEAPAEATPTPQPTEAQPARNARATPTESPTPSASATVQRTSSPTPSPSPSPTESPSPEPTDTPLPTPDADTVLLTMPTKPPVQSSFDELLATNPDTVGYLAMGDLLTLPVVQRENDNDFYLDHGFEQQEAREGALFLDGVNRLVPEDDCLIVYGHNMKNGTMFGRLGTMRKADVLKKHAVVRFDTLYANHLYVPFAAFYASMSKDRSNYFEVRRFLMEPEEFEAFVEELKDRSRMDVPVDVAYGDSLLLLVTCDYHGDDSRFILALRRLREGESEADAQAMVKKAK